MPRGMFVTFEGIEGCGKSTQARLAAEALRQDGVDVVLTREPGGTPIAERIREVVLAVEHGEMCTECEVLLYLAARAQHVSQLIKPAVERGCVVICDRFADATYAYQGYGRGVDRTKLVELNDFATAGLVPDFTIMFDITVELSRERLASQNRSYDRIESGTLEFFERIRAGYLELAQKRQDRVVVIDASQPLDSVAREVRNTLRSRFSR